MKADFTISKINQAGKLVKQFAPDLSDNELFVMNLCLKEIAKAAISDYLKGLINLSNELEWEIKDN